MVEIIVVGLILSVSLAVWMYVLSGTRHHSHKERLAQELQNRRARLLGVLKNDIRSAVNVHQAGKNQWKLEVLARDGDKPPETIVVRYRAEKTRVERESRGERKVFEFGELLQGKKLVFSITP